MTSSPHSNHALRTPQQAACVICQVVRFLWPLSIPPQMYGDASGEVLLTTNCRPVLRGLLRALGERSVITLDAGGLPPQAAAAFGTVSTADARRTLREHSISEETLVSIPRSLAAAWGWKEGSESAGWNIHLVADDEIAYLNGKSPSSAPVSDRRFDPLSRVALSVGYGVGQALFFALPLAVFGTAPLVIGISMLLVAAVLLGLFWQLIPGTGLVRGAAVGLVLFLCLSAWMIATTGVSNLTWLRMPASAFLLAAWMGIVLQGNR